MIYKGELIKNVSVGSYVKILKGFIPIIGKVEKECIEPSKEKQDSNYSSREDRIDRLLFVKLLGYFEGDKYCRGIKELPLIDNECYLLTGEEFAEIHYFIKNSKDIPLKIGTLASDSFVSIELGVSALFSSHIGIFGNTGSGKSYTLSKLYRQLFENYKNNNSFKTNAKFLFFDFNGEYAGGKTIIAGKKIYNLSTRKIEENETRDKLPLTNEDFLNLDLLCIFANATEKTQRPFMKRCIALYKKIERNNDNKQKKENHIKNILKQQIKEILCMSDKVKSETLIKYIKQILPEKLDNGIVVSLTNDIEFHNKDSVGYYIKNSSPKEYIQSNPALSENTTLYKQVDKFVLSDNNFIRNFISVMYIRIVYDILGNDIQKEHIEPAIHKLDSIASDIEKLFDFSGQANTFWDKNNIVIINLNNVNLDSKKMLQMFLAHKLYTEHKAKQEKGKEESYLNIIVDEAHNILSYQSNRESESWKDYRLEVFEEIIKEGRKFGVFMTIASQRPSDISETIISQLHNYFIHRLVNEYDIKMVGKAISYLDKVSVESLPILSTGVCIIAGQLAEMPIVVQIDKIEDENKPLNETIDVISKWEMSENVSSIEEKKETDNIKNDDLPF
ncbi:MAG: ATP-binding protein [Prevotellaceae bacterium]|nr:ATP-binding protein [Prevotellaceae bacterium]